MSLRVIWQYMDRSVTKKILYESQKLRSICTFFNEATKALNPPLSTYILIDKLFIQTRLKFVLLFTNYNNNQQNTK